MDEGGGGTRGPVLIDPSMFPTINTQPVYDAAQALRDLADASAGAMNDTIIEWANLSMPGVYESPEKEELYAALDPAAHNVTDMVKRTTFVAKALKQYADELDGYARALEALRQRTAEFRGTIGSDGTVATGLFGTERVAWDQDWAGAHKTNSLLIGELHAILAEASESDYRCAGAIELACEFADLDIPEAVPAAALTGEPQPWGHQRQFELTSDADGFQKFRYGLYAGYEDFTTGLSSLILGRDPASGRLFDFKVYQQSIPQFIDGVKTDLGGKLGLALYLVPFAPEPLKEFREDLVKEAFTQELAEYRIDLDDPDGNPFKQWEEEKFAESLGYGISTFGLNTLFDKVMDAKPGRSLMSALSGDMADFVDGGRLGIVADPNLFDLDSPTRIDVDGPRAPDVDVDATPRPDVDADAALRPLADVDPISGSVVDPDVDIDGSWVERRELGEKSHIETHFDADDKPTRILGTVADGDNAHSRTDPDIKWQDKIDRRHFNNSEWAQSIKKMFPGLYAAGHAFTLRVTGTSYTRVLDPRYPIDTAFSGEFAGLKDTLDDIRTASTHPDTGEISWDKTYVSSLDPEVQTQIRELLKKEGQTFMFPQLAEINSGRYIHDFENQVMAIAEKNGLADFEITFAYDDASSRVPTSYTVTYTDVDGNPVSHTFPNRPR